MKEASPLIGQMRAQLRGAELALPDARQRRYIAQREVEVLEQEVIDLREALDVLTER